MEECQVEEAIAKAQHGITQYLELMELVPRVNVACNGDFQRKFNAYYKVRQRSAEWYKAYYSCMELLKPNKPTFDDVLDHLWNSLGRCEPSFSSKLVATLDPNQPIWDKFILKNTKTKRPSYTSRNKVTQAKAAYQSIRSWYGQFLGSDEGKLVISVFNQHVKEHARITDLKKVDFVLWQTRA